MQADCVDLVDWNKKKEHICLSCLGIDKAQAFDKKKKSAPLADTLETNDPEKASSEDMDVDTRQDTEVAQYFDRKRPAKKTKAGGIRSELVVPSAQECVTEVKALYDESNADQELAKFEEQYHQQFDQWSFSLATKQSILLYGRGSKKSLLTSFANYLAPEGDVISLNGYDPTIDLTQFLDILDQVFCNGSGPNSTAGNNIGEKQQKYGWAKTARHIAKTFASSRTRPLFLLIHNIDGVGLRNRFAQDAISTLTVDSRKDDTPMIRVVASVDNVNAGMFLWNPQVKHKFDWVSVMCHDCLLQLYVT